MLCFPLQTSKIMIMMCSRFGLNYWCEQIKNHYRSKQIFRSMLEDEALARGFRMYDRVLESLDPD